MRYLAIGDIHGCYRALRALVELVDRKPDDRWITLGDYLNRGPASRQVLDWLIEQHSAGQLIALRGNHEIMTLVAREDGPTRETWQSVGGRETLASYSSLQGETPDLKVIPDDHWEFLQNSLVSHFETDRHFFVHANAVPDCPIHDQPEFVLYWEQFINPPPHESGKIMICGHTSQKSGLPLNHGHAICIDTWVYGKGWLSCLDVDSGTVWQANEAGQTRQLSLSDLPDSGDL